MPELTPNLNIPKPTGDEYVNRASFNAIWDQIDSAASQASNIKIADADNKISATTVEGAIQELFTNADNAQRSFAGVVGSPSVPGDTVTKITSDLQTAKNTLASNLTAKGQSAQGTESLASLVGKAANVNTGKKFASGTVISSMNVITFQARNGSAFQSNFVSVTGLSFKPSTIVIYAPDGYVSTAFSDSASITVDGYKLGDLLGFGPFRIGTINATISNTGFQLPVAYANNVHKWVAYE